MNWVKTATLTLSCNIWAKVFKNGPSKICGRQTLKNLRNPSHFKRL